MDGRDTESLPKGTRTQALFANELVLEAIRLFLDVKIKNEAVIAIFLAAI
jgi:hypothetical protein